MRGNTLGETEPSMSEHDIFSSTVMAGLDPAIPLMKGPRCHIIGIAGSGPAITDVVKACGGRTVVNAAVRLGRPDQ
jgi:hypothetical protein